jgi:MSHA biogenesis protein MshN
MGFLQMSLINKMLQDLEERRSNGELTGTMHHQIRAAPEPQRIHFAWWIALALVLVAVSALSWIWGRQTAPVPAPLGLKLAPDLIVAEAAKKTAAGPVLPAAASVPSVPAAIVDNKPVPDKLVNDQPAVNTSKTMQSELPAAAVSSPVVQAPAQPSPAAAQSPAQPPVAQTAARPAAPTFDASVALPTARVRQAALPNAPQIKTKPASTNQGKAQEKTFDYELPANVSKQFKELTPQQRGENEYRKAVSQMQQGRAAEAIATLEQTLQIDPQNALARQTLVGLLLESKRQDEAVRRLQEGLALDRSQAGLAMMLARLQVERRELRPAIETLQRTLPSASERADYQAFLAALYQRDGRHKDAIEAYSVSLGKSPQNGLWWMGMAISLQADNRLTEARDAFGRAKASGNLSPDLQAFVEQKLNQLR